jgi:hypothetical protein
MSTFLKQLVKRINELYGEGGIVFLAFTLGFFMVLFLIHKPILALGLLFAFASAMVIEALITKK